MRSSWRSTPREAAQPWDVFTHAPHADGLVGCRRLGAPQAAPRAARFCSPRWTATAPAQKSSTSSHSRLRPRRAIPVIAPRLRCTHRPPLRRHPLRHARRRRGLDPSTSAVHHRPGQVHLKAACTHPDVRPPCPNLPPQGGTESECVAFMTPPHPLVGVWGWGVPARTSA